MEERVLSLGEYPSKQQQGGGGCKPHTPPGWAMQCRHPHSCSCAWVKTPAIVPPPLCYYYTHHYHISPGTNFCYKTTQNLSGVTVCIISHSCVQVCWFGQATGSVEICSRVSHPPGTSRLPGAQPFPGDGRECGDRQKCTGALQAWAQNWCTGHSYPHSTC